MAQIKNLIAKWGAAWPSPMIISRQYDNGQYRIDLFNYPEPEHIVDEQTEQMEVLSYYLIVWMKETEDGEPREMSPIQLSGPYWIVPNYYTQLVQDIRFQFCVQSDSTDYEAHSAIFTGRIVDSIEHDGDPVDVTPAEMFDAYKAYVNDLIVAAGDVQIDTSLSVSGAAAEAKAVGDALSSTNERLDEQQTDLDSLATSGATSVQYSVEVGMINSDGQDYQNGNNFYRRTNYINLADIDSVVISESEGMGYWYALYDSSKAFISRTEVAGTATLKNLGDSGYIRIAAYSYGGMSDELFTSGLNFLSRKSFIANSISDINGNISDINESISGLNENISAINDSLSTVVEPELLDGIKLVVPNASQTNSLRYNISAGDKFLIEADCEIGKTLTIGTQTSSSGSGYTETLFSSNDSTHYKEIIEATADASYFKIFSEASGVSVTIKKQTDNVNNPATPYYFCGEYKVTSTVAQYISCPFKNGNDVWLEVNNATSGTEITIGVVSNSGQAGYEAVIFNSKNTPTGIFRIKHHALSDYGYIKIYTSGNIDVSITKGIPDSDILSSPVGDAIVVQKVMPSSVTYINYPVFADSYYHVHLSNVSVGSKIEIGSNSAGGAGFAEPFISILNATKTEYDALIRATQNQEVFKYYSSAEGVVVTLYSFKGAVSACGGAKGHTTCGVNVLGGEKDYCVAIGANTLHDNTGIKNIAVGNDNMGDCTGHDNTSIGYHASFRNTSGIGNAAVGSEAQDDNTTGNRNSAIGFCSLQRNNTGSNNVAVGALALQGIESASYDPENLKSFDNNVAVGASALRNAESGSENNIAIGHGALGTQKQYKNCIAIGKDTDCTKNNQMMLGSSAITEVVLMGNKKLIFNSDGSVTWEALS